MPKERHEQKESNDSTLGLCIVPKESHGCPGLVFAHQVPTYQWTGEISFDHLVLICFSAYLDVNCLEAMTFEPGPIDGLELS